MLKQCSRCAAENNGTGFCVNCGTALKPVEPNTIAISDADRLRAMEVRWARAEADRAERERRGRTELQKQASEYDTAALALAGFALFALGVMAASFYAAEAILGACSLFCAFCFIVMAAACHGEADERRNFISLLWPEQPQNSAQPTSCSPSTMGRPFPPARSASEYV